MAAPRTPTGNPRGETAPVGALATHGAIPWLVAAAMACAGLIGIQRSTFLNNEGVLTWIFAGLMGESTRDMLFFMKARPPISLFYAPVAAIGLTPFLWAHLLVAVLAVPLTASLARRFGQQRPNLAAALVALSPLYFAGAAAGVQNTDATVGLLAVAWLMSRERALAAGLLLGVVVLGRVETALFAVILAAYAALTPRYRRLLVGLPAVPVVFFLLGATYHGSLLWPLHYPSSALENAAIAPDERAFYGGNLNDLVTTLLALTPVIGALAWTSLRPRWSLEAVLSGTAIGFVLAIRVLPVTQLIYVSASPRNVMPALPFLCLALGRVAERWGGRWTSTLAPAALLLGLAAIAVERLEGWVGTLLAVTTGACIVSAALALWSRRAAATVLVLAAAAFTASTALAPERLPVLPRTRLYLGDGRELAQCARWIEANVPRGGVVVTDQHLLAIWLSRHAPSIDVDVRHVVQPDTLYEAKALTDPKTPQFEKLFRSARFFYAPWIFREEIASLPGDVYFVMRTDSEHRAGALREPPFDRVEWLATTDDWVAGRLARNPGSASR